MLPLISIIVPCYNVERYLPKCVDSILNQTYKNLEVWLVDDGSPDRCGIICDEYAQKDTRIKVIHKQNGGLSDARNVAIDVATGEYIVFIDSDDRVTFDHVETLYNLAQKYEVDLAAAQFMEEHEGFSTTLDKDTPKEYKLGAEDALETMFYQDKIENSAWGKIYKRSLFATGIRYPKGKLYEDFATTYKLIEKAGSVAITSKKTTFYLIRNDSIQGECYNERKNAILEFGDQLLEHFQPSKAKLYNAICCRLLSAYFNIFFQMERGNKWESVYWKRICCLRANVCHNSKARKKARIAAFLSYLGIDITRFIFSFNKKMMRLKLYHHNLHREK